MGMLKHRRLFHISLLMLLLGIGGRICFAEIVNSVVARVNNNIITLRDAKIEYQILKMIFKDEAKTGNELIDNMIDRYLVLSEVKRVYQKKLKQETKTRIESEVKKFESLFGDGEYDDFLAKFEITRDDIYLRFKNIVLIDKFLRQKIQIKKNGSNVDENMVLSEQKDEQFSLDVKTYIKKLRDKADRITINDVFKESQYPERNKK
jgi:hypothetical protein